MYTDRSAASLQSAVTRVIECHRRIQILAGALQLRRGAKLLALSLSLSLCLFVSLLPSVSLYPVALSMAAAVAASGMPTLDSCLAHPLEVVQASFANADTAQWEQQVEHGMRSIFSTPEAVAMIPSLNDTPVDRLRPGSLVRFRCMVQDVQDPEYYMGTFQHTNVLTGEKSVATAKYRDAIPPQSEPMQDVLPQERLPLYCVPVPGETAWAAETHAISGALAPSTPVAEQATSRGKRSMDSEDESEPVVQPSPPRHRASTTKAGGAATTGVAAQGSPKAAAMQLKAFPRREANRPIAGSGGVACLVKVYDEAGASIRVHETFEFVGVLSVAPELAFGGDSDWVDGIEQTVPYSELPRLHAVFYRKVDPNTEPLMRQQLLPLPPAATAAAGFPLEPALAVLAPQVPVLRETFINTAAAALGAHSSKLTVSCSHSLSQSNSVPYVWVIRRRPARRGVPAATLPLAHLWSHGGPLPWAVRPQHHWCGRRFASAALAGKVFSAPWLSLCLSVSVCLSLSLSLSLFSALGPLLVRFRAAEQRAA